MSYFRGLADYETLPHCASSAADEETSPSNLISFLYIDQCLYHEILHYESFATKAESNRLGHSYNYTID